ncbi:MAG: DUF3307 domain-containing protein [Balneolaceae bacterium]|nr:DUF3307 domain-containing protein [Balneolaceae bacterium]
MRLLTAHLLADFYMQPNEWIEDRKDFGIRSRSLYMHIIILGILTYFFLADWDEWFLPVFITVTHLLIDWWKSKQEARTKNFIIDQMAHSIIILIAWLWYTDLYNPFIAHFDALMGNHQLWVLAAAFLIILRPSGFLIEKVTSRWRKELVDVETPRIKGLRDAGTWIGYLERVIILILILIQQYSAIGFLIAAKSIFRFSGGMKDREDRKQAEYILIGTLLSFAIAIFVGLGAATLLQL